MLHIGERALLARPIVVITSCAFFASNSLMNGNQSLSYQHLYTNGVFYYLGTKGGQSAFTNPATSGQVSQKVSHETGTIAFAAGMLKKRLIGISL